MKTPPFWSLWACALVLLVSPFARGEAPAAPLRVTLIGDSTMCEYPDADPRRGWGHFLQGYFQDDVQVINLARSGRSTKTFISEGWWAKALQTKPAFVFIQFGHNDSHGAGHPEATEAATDYRDNLRRYIDETRAIGGIPVLVTPMARRNFGPDGRILNALQPYVDAMKAVAAEKQVGLIDLNNRSVALFEGLGKAGSLALANRPDDSTHFNEKGARAMVDLVMKDLPAAVPALDGRLRPVSHLVLLGTNTGGGSHGIYAVRLDGATGALSAPTLAAETPNPSFLALHPSGLFVYAHSAEGKLADGRAAGAIRSFALDPVSGHLTPLNVQLTGDPVPSGMAIDGTGRMVITVSGTGGKIATLPTETNGRLGPVASYLRNDGPPGPVKTRQEATYPHSGTFSPDNRFVLVADLGLDRVFTYRFDPATAILTPGISGYASFAPGTGTRHAKFSADSRFFYVIGELASTITVCAYDAATGRITPGQTISTLPVGFKGDNLASEIRIHPNGRFVYAANRGHNSIVTFARDAATGRLTPIETVPSGGDFPRNFALTPDGKWLLCAHQNSGNLTVFGVDPDTGRLHRTPYTQKVPKAICVLFFN